MNDINEKIYQRLSDKHGIPFNEIKLYFETFFDILNKELEYQDYDAIYIANFAKFVPKVKNFYFRAEFFRQPKIFRNFYKDIYYKHTKII